MYADSLNTKYMLNTERELVLAPIDGKKPLSSHGSTDNRLFKGGNKLWAIMDKQTSLWHLKYEQGVLPEPFRQRFTSFSKLKAFVDDYYARRNLQIVDVKDVATN